LGSIKSKHNQEIGGKYINQQVTNSLHPMSFGLQKMAMKVKCKSESTRIEKIKSFQYYTQLFSRFQFKKKSFLKEGQVIFIL
jgi:hypothetical protein